MVLDRSAKMFIAIATLVASTLLVTNHIIDQAPIEEWLASGILFAISLIFWAWLWREGLAEETGLVVSEEQATEPAVREWVISEEVVAELEQITHRETAGTTSPARDYQTRAVEVEPGEVDIPVGETVTPEEIVEEIVEATPDEAEIVKEAEEGDPIAEEVIAEAEAAKQAEENAEETDEVIEEEVKLPEAEDTEERSEETTQPAVDPDEPDDLTRIEGIGPKYRDALQSTGINTFQELASSETERLIEIIRGAGMRKPGSIETWAEQAALAVDNDWDKLDQLQKEMRGGRRG